jgi:hypothetical protein
MFQRSDMVTVRSTHNRGPVFRYLKPVEKQPRMSWLEIPYTGRVFKFPDVLLRHA